MLHCAALAAPPKVYSHRPAESCSWGFLNDCPLRGLSTGSGDSDQLSTVKPPTHYK